MPEPASLEGQVVVITGGSAGIGRSAALTAADLGAAVVVAARGEAAGLATVAAIECSGGRARFVATDIGRDADAAGLVAATLDAFGRLDVLVNNAAEQAGTMGSIEEIDEAAAGSLNVNLMGPLYAIKHALPPMLDAGRGVVINVASVVGTHVPRPDAMLYGATKAGVVSVTAALAVGYGDEGIQSYAVCPWVTDTPGTDRLTGGDRALKEGFAAANNPHGRLLTPEEVADVIVALAAGEELVPNGAALLVNGDGDVSRLDLRAVPCSLAAA